MSLRVRLAPSSSIAGGTLAVLLAGCPASLDASFDATDGGRDAPPRGGEASCPDVPSAVLAARCGNVGCHGATNPAGGLDLASGGVASRLAGKRASQGGLLLDASSPSASVLYTKLGPKAPFGSAMPLGSAPLDDATRACVLAWISSTGAPSGTLPAAGGSDDASVSSAADAGPATPDARSGWTPSDLPGLALWLDASESVTTVGARVSAWRDRSARHNDATQGADGNRPSLVAGAINGHAALKFEESRETFVSIPDADSLRWGTGGFAIAVVAANRKATAGRRHGGGVSTVFAKPHMTGTTEIAFHLNWFTAEATDDDGNVHVGLGEGHPGEQSKGFTSNDGRPRVYVARVTPAGGGADYELFVNGASAGMIHADGAVDVTLAGSPVRIGSTYGQSVEGDVAELVAVKGALPDADVSTLTTYLAARYGLAP